VFSAVLPRAEAYADLLADAGVVRGLIGPREVPRLWERHLVNCALLASALPAADSRGTLPRVADIGSGAGLPGLVLAMMRPDLSITLVEPLLRRTTFLTEVAQQLELDNVVVARARAEELHGRRTFDVVTSRAVAPLPRLLRWSMPLVAPGGAMLAMKGASAADEVAAAAKDLRRAGVRDVGVESYGDDIVDPPTRVIRVVAGAGPGGGSGDGSGAGTGAGAGGPGGGRRRQAPGRRSIGGRRSRSEP
jgi:16S rRNA (guanine527-N7)-methyltransferase